MRLTDPHPRRAYPLETLKAEHADVYVHVPPPGRPIPIEETPLPVDDNIPGEEDIYEAILRLRLHCTRSPSRMRSKHLRIWLCTATREEYPDPGNWEKVVAIIQVASRVGELLASC